MLLFLAPILSIITILLLAIMPFITRKQNIIIKNLSSIITQTNQDIQTFIIEKIRIIKKVYILNTENKEKEIFLEYNKKFKLHRYRRIRIQD